jgi:DNA-binding transcriptional LysR family regulator
MHIETLKTFRDLVDSGSFRRAAEANLVSQSAVSQQLKTLEQRYGCQLLERSTRGGVALTDAGRLLYGECRLLLDRLDQVERQLRERSTEIAGAIRIATVYSVGLHALPPFVTRFMQDHPRVAVHVEYSRTDRICRDCAAGSIDLGIVALPLPKAGLVATLWRQEPLVLVCAPNHRLASRRRVRLADIAGEPFVAFERDIPTRKTVDALLRAHGVAVRPVMQFDNIETIKRCVGVGNGVSILPDVTVAGEVRSGALRAIRIADGPALRQLAIVHRRGRALPGAVRAFVEMLGADTLAP